VPFPRHEGFPVWELSASPSTGWPFEGELGELRETGSTYLIAGGVQAMGQVLNTYLIARSIEGLVIVDQHAAHEQVLYERMSAGAKPQALPSPVRLNLTVREAEMLHPALPLLADLGFDVEPFGGHSFLVRALPVPIVEQPPAELLTTLIEELGRLRDRDWDALREGLAMKAACTAAVKAGDHLSLDEQQALLDDLMQAWSPATCPHGRPVFVVLAKEELERRFLRR